MAWEKKHKCAECSGKAADSVDHNNYNAVSFRGYFHLVKNKPLLCTVCFVTCFATLPYILDLLREICWGFGATGRKR